MAEGCSSPKKAKMVTDATGDAPPADSDENKENKDVEVVDSQEVGDAQQADEVEIIENNAAKEEKPVVQFKSELVDFSRPRPQPSQTAESIAVLKGPNAIAVGFPHFSFIDHGTKSSKAFSYVDPLNGGKIEHTSNDHVFLLDHTFTVDNKVIRFVNKDEGTANAKKCKSKPGMVGIVTAVNQTADVRIVDANGVVREDIIRAVDLTCVEEVRTLSHNWCRNTAVFGNVMGRVTDCLYRCRLRDPEGRRLEVTASCQLDSKNGVYLSHAVEKELHLEEQPIFVGDRVKIMPHSNTKDVKQFIQFVDIPSPADYVATGVEFVVKDLEMTRIQIREPRKRVSGSLPNLSDLTSPPSTPASPSSPIPPVAVPDDIANELGIVTDFTATSQMPVGFAASALLAMDTELENISKQLTDWRGGQIGKDQAKNLWIEQIDLEKIHFLPDCRRAYMGNNTTVYNVILDGDYSVVSLNDYNSLLVNELKDVFSGDILTDPEPLDLRKDSFKSRKCVVQVVRRHTKCDVRWYDGSVSKAVPSYELCHYNRVAHHTERLVHPGLFTTRRSPTEDTEKKSKEDEESMFAEFGLITIVREDERMMTVRWFRKNPSSDENAPKYQFVEEETICTYDYSRHFLQRFPLGAGVRLKDDEGKDLVNVIGTVISDSDDGYQVVRLLNGEEKRIWPGEANLVGGYPSPRYVEDGDLFYDDDFDETQEGSGLGEELAGENSTGTDSADFLDDYDDEMGSSDVMYSPSYNVLPPTPQSLLLEFQQLTGTVAPSSSASLSGIRTCAANAKKSKTGQCHGEICTKLVCKLTKSTEKKMSSPESLRAYAALRLVTHPQPPCQSIPDDDKEIKGIDKFIERADLVDAQMFISFFLNRPTSEAESAEFAQLNEKYPGWEAQAHALFAINEKLNLSELAFSTLGHLRETTPPPPPPTNWKGSRVYVYNPYDNYISPNILIFPADEQTKAKVDEVLAARLENVNSGLYHRGRFMQLTYLAPSHFSTISSPDGLGICHVQYNEAYLPKAITLGLKAELGQGVIVASESDAIMIDHFMQTQLGIQEGNPAPEQLLEDSTRFHKEKAWNNALKDYQYSKPYGATGNCKDENISLKNLTFDFKELAEKMGLAEDPLFSDGMTRNSKADVDAIRFSAPFVADDKIPSTLKLEVAADCSNDDFTDTHLAFHALSQILTSPTWPTCTITINKHMFAGNTWDVNFVRALLILRKGNLLYGPYFNYADAKILERWLVQEFLKQKGELTVRFGTELVEELCKITKKMTDNTCIPLWKRLNAMEELFSTEDIVSQIRHIISNPQAADTSRLTSISSLNNKVASVTNDARLQDELKSWIPEVPQVLGEQSTSAKRTFQILEKVVLNHKFIGKVSTSNRQWLRRVLNEHKLLQSELVEGMHVVAYEDRTDLFRAVIVGPPGTPYEGIPFLFDIQLPPAYPSVPPLVHYHSYSKMALNPNLYTEGKVCLSLLGTWPGQTENDSWNSVKSSVFQAVFSIHSEILMTDVPYFKEPGFEKRRNQPESIEASTRFNGQVLLASMDSLTKLMKSPPDDVAPILIKHFKDVVPGHLRKVRRWLDGSEVPEFPIVFDKGLLTTLNRVVTSAEAALQNWVDAEVNPAVAAEPPRSEHPSSSQAVDVESPKEKRTLFSEGDPLYVCTEYKAYVLERL